MYFSENATWNGDGLVPPAPPPAPLVAPAAGAEFAAVVLITPDDCDVGGGAGVGTAVEGGPICGCGVVVVVAVPPEASGPSSDVSWPSRPAPPPAFLTISGGSIDDLKKSCSSWVL